jgi:predicted RecB family nuclease
MSETVVLGGYPAKRCARAVHNDFSPSSPPRPPVDPATQRLFGDGVAFEAAVNERLAGADGALLLSDADGWEANEAATLAAMRDGVPVVVNGRLPRVGARVGAPDVLVRLGDGYVPVDVKLHGTRKPAARRASWVSSLSAPAERRLVGGLSESNSHLEHDGMQLAHYTRMLQELGFHAGPGHLVGGIVGASDYGPEGGDPWLVQWFDLAKPRRDTYSATAAGGRARRSLLERYDHEFAFRLKVAAAAAAGQELVRPFHVYECRTCVWAAHCRDVVGPRDASFSVRAGLPTAQQWRLLYDDGVRTLDDLAALDPALVPAGWSPRDTQPGPPAEARFRLLVRRARMARDGEALQPLGAWPRIPKADVEVDFDIEWDVDNRIYLWGLRVRQGQDDATAVFDPVLSYDPLDDDGAERLADRFADRLGRLVADAEASGRTLAVYHWAQPERSMTRRYPRVDALLEGRSVDLYAWFRDHFLTLGGNSLKAVAPIFGFRWGVQDPGGAESQLKIEAARAHGTGAAAAREWLTRYNESDVAAQAAIRDGLRRLRAEAAVSGGGTR